MAALGFEKLAVWTRTGSPGIVMAALATAALEARTIVHIGIRRAEAVAGAVRRSAARARVIGEAGGPIGSGILRASRDAKVQEHDTE